MGNNYTWTITFTPTLVMPDDSGHEQSDQSAIELLSMAEPADALSRQTRMQAASLVPRGRGGSLS